MTSSLLIPPANDAERREPAPGELELIRQLVNSVDIDEGYEELPDPPGLRGWLTERGLVEPGAPVSEADLRLVIEVREALRSLLLSNHGGPSDPRALETLNSAARLSPVVVSFGDDGDGELAPAGSGVPAAVGALLAIVHASMRAGTFERLKVCPAEDCLWAFYDHSRNHSKQWCRMEACGNRAKARNYRERHRAD